MLELSQGMPLLHAPTFSGCADFAARPHLSSSFRQASAAVEKMVFTDFWQEGLAIILTEPDAAIVPLLGLFLAGWAKKQGKPCGRPIVNGSGRMHMPENEILNSAQARQAAVDRFGEINHPVIQ